MQGPINDAAASLHTSPALKHELPTASNCWRVYESEVPFSEVTFLR